MYRKKAGLEVCSNGLINGLVNEANWKYKSHTHTLRGLSLRANYTERPPLVEVLQIEGKYKSKLIN
jgi:hypothetical protein